MMRPLAIDLFCGLGGWTEGLLAEGYEAHGFDIEAHEYGDEKYPGTLFLEDVLTLDGARFKDAALIVASPPCQEFSYMAMPWKRAKQIARALRGKDEFPEPYKGSRSIGELTALFDACFRIQREASAAAGRQIPLVVENVKGAQPWVGRAKWSFGSYFLWGDVPALMPIQKYHLRQKVRAGEQWNINRTNFTGTQGWDEGLKNPGFRFDGSGKSFQTESVVRHVEGTKNTGGSWFNVAHNKTSGVANNPVSVPAEGLKAPGGAHRLDGAPHTRHLTHPREGVKMGDGGWFNDGDDPNRSALMSSKSPARKAAAAKIAKIPFALSSWIARTYKPVAERCA